MDDDMRDSEEVRKEIRDWYKDDLRLQNVLVSVAAATVYMHFDTPEDRDSFLDDFQQDPAPFLTNPSVGRGLYVLKFTLI